MTIDSQGQGAAAPEEEALDRRSGADRRKQPLRALFYGSFNPRRRGSRRDGERRVSGVDWHDPQWLAVAMLIVLFSCVDAFLTLTLVDHGAYEVNPFMAPLVTVSAFDLGQDRLCSFGAYRFLYERLLGAPVRLRLRIV